MRVDTELSGNVTDFLIAWILLRIVLIWESLPNPLTIVVDEDICALFAHNLLVSFFVIDILIDFAYSHHYNGKLIISTFSNSLGWFNITALLYCTLSNIFPFTIQILNREYLIQLITPHINSYVVW
jgi:hypothetical protein